MTRLPLRWPETTVVSLVAALATWVTLLAWTPFSERSNAYIAPLLAACLLVAAGGALLRTARTPALLVALIQLVVLAVWLHHRWAGDEAWGGWLPTPESLAQVSATLSAAVESAQDYAAPVPRSVTEFAPLMVVAGAATAVLVDFIACGLRRAPIAGLPLLAVYTAPVSILDGGVHWVKFAAAGLLFLLLIAAQESIRLTHWGQQVTLPGRAPDPLVTGQAVWSSARKIGFSATGLAVVIPIIVPTLSLRFFDGIGGLGGDGDGDSVSLSNPILDMRRDLLRGEDRDLVRVESPTDDPSYLRISVLDSFDGETWRPSSREIPVDQRAEGLVPRAPGLDAGVERRTVPWTIEVSDEFESRWLPTPYPVYSINAAGDWRYDRRTLDFISAADDQSTAGMQYDLEAVELSPTAEQLEGSGPAPATVFGPNTELPEVMPAVVRDLARQVTSDADGTFEQATALQQWFRVDGDFQYSLDRAEQGNGLEQIERFLSEGDGGRVGYCEQFAAGMALMARSLNIPARVAVGFLRPEPEPGGDAYTYSSHDLHSWPELYFEGIGWTRFEPTPGIRTGGVPNYTRDAQGRTEDPAAPNSSAAAAPSLNRFDQPSAQAGADTAATSESAADVKSLVAGLAALALVVALALAPRLVRDWRRRRRWSAATTPAALAEAAWVELRDSAVDLEVAWSDAVTLRTRARELVRSFGRPGGSDDALSRATYRGPEANPEATLALERMVQRLEVARFSRPVLASPAQRADVESDVSLCVEALHAGASNSQRSRARWLPTSLVGRLPTGRPIRRVGSLMDEPGVDHAM